jgi:uncharacterized phage-associated protein
MIITHHREKLINAIIYFVRNTKNCGKTKLMKLLYFLDFIHFKQTGKSVTGMDYYAWDFGPVPAQVWEELKGGMGADMKEAIIVSQKGDFHHVQPKKKFCDQFFTNRELKILEQVSFIFRDATTNEMVELTHLENTPWDKTLKEQGEFAKIDYFLSIDSKDDSLDIEQAVYRYNEREEMYKIFGKQ